MVEHGLAQSAGGDAIHNAAFKMKDRNRTQLFSPYFQHEISPHSFTQRLPFVLLRLVKSLNRKVSPNTLRGSSFVFAD
jgi:hypothetical protein